MVIGPKRSKADTLCSAGGVGKRGARRAAGAESTDDVTTSVAGAEQSSLRISDTVDPNV